jgi:hypothetical protein
LLGKIVFDNSIELLLAFDLRDVGSEVPCSGFVLGIATSEFSHEHGTSMHAESFDDQIVMVEHDFALLIDRGVWRDWTPFESRSRLGKQPWLT